MFRHGQRHARLANAAGPGQSQEPHPRLVEQGQGRAPLLGSSDQLRRRSRKGRQAGVCGPCCLGNLKVIALSCEMQEMRALIIGE